jgi:dipeptidyl aminopeptidase/acylaminoacyl peptidase
MIQLRVFFSLVVALISTISFSQVFDAEALWQLNRLGSEVVNPGGTHIIYRSSNYDLSQGVSNPKSFNRFNLVTTKDKSIQLLPGSEFILGNIQWINDNEFYCFAKVDGIKQIIRRSITGTSFSQLSISTAEQIEEFKVSANGEYLVAVQTVSNRKNVSHKHPDLKTAEAYISDELMYRHWDEWDNGDRKQLFLYSISNNQLASSAINLLSGTDYHGVLMPFGGLENVVFHPDNNSILYVSKKLSGTAAALSTNSEIYQFIINSQQTVNLTNGYKGYDTHPLYSPDGKSFAWLSMARDGFEADKNDIILRGEDGNDINLTKQIDLTVEHFVWSEDGKKIYFLATIEATVQLFELDIKKREHRQITTGFHNYTSLHQRGKSIYAMRQSMLHPNELFEVDIKTGKGAEITDENGAYLSEFGRPQIEKRWVKTTDGKNMLTWVILPPNFDENKKYPALLYCQGGPQSAVSQFFSFRWNFRLMASQGYVIIAPNRRGLPGFGQEWNDAISKDWGGQAMQDYLSAVDAVKTAKYIDEKRIGAVGASYGGYSVYYLAGMHEGRFKSFISHCGLYNLTSWYGSTEELFFANWDIGGAYWDPKLKDDYIKHSPHTNVDKWDTPILVIHGGKDYRVPDTQGLEAFQAAQLRGIKSRLLYFPNENHWVLNLHNSILWHRTFYGWLKETL